MMVVKRFDVLSVGLMLGCTYACIGLIIGGIFSLLSLAGGMAGQKGGGAAAMMVGVGSIIIFPLIYGVMGFLGGMLSAFVYNIVAGFAGGIKVELKEAQYDRPHARYDDDDEDDRDRNRDRRRD